LKPGFFTHVALLHRLLVQNVFWPNMIMCQFSDKEIKKNTNRGAMLRRHALRPGGGRVKAWQAGADANTWFCDSPKVQRWTSPESGIWKSGSFRVVVESSTWT
jgi:hypothetical protein